MTCGASAGLSRSVPCTAGWDDVCGGRDPQGIFHPDPVAGYDGFCDLGLHCFPYSRAGSSVPVSDHGVSAAELLLVVDLAWDFSRSRRSVLQLGGC